MKNNISKGRAAYFPELEGFARGISALANAPRPRTPECDAERERERKDAAEAKRRRKANRRRGVRP